MLVTIKSVILFGGMVSPGGGGMTILIAPAEETLMKFETDSSTSSPDIWSPKLKNISSSKAKKAFYRLVKLLISKVS